MYDWKSLNQLFEILNKNCMYLILRNFEDIYTDYFLKNHPDIDFLCDKADRLIEYLKAAPRSTKPDRIHYYISVEQTIIPVDIREIGDGYYDEKWEIDMLKKRILNPLGFYVMDGENYYYSLLYHANIHKYCVTSDYIERLQRLSVTQNKSYEEENGIKILESFMTDKGYKYTYPVCPGGILNLKGTDKSLLKFDARKNAKRCIYIFEKKMVNLVKRCLITSWEKK